MTPEQTKKYLKHRLNQLGWTGTPAITRQAFEMICGYTGGIPEEIDQLCDWLPLAGGQDNNSRITKDTIKSAIRELNLAKQPGKQGDGRGSGMSANEIRSIEQLAAELKSKMHAVERAEAEGFAADQAETLLSESKKLGAGGQGTAVSQGKPKILVVDDSTTARTVIHKALENDFVCVEAKDGEEAWNTLLSDTEIAIAIVDLEMPTLDGVDLIKRIKTSHVSRIATTPALVVAATTDTMAKKEAYMAGADDFITKSTDPFELLVRVRTHCSTLSQAKSKPTKNQGATGSKMRSPTGYRSDDIDVPLLNDQLAVTSELSGMEADAAWNNIEYNSRGGVARRETRAQPAVVAMAVVASLLAVVVVVLTLYERTQPAGTSESIELASAETTTQEEQAVEQHVPDQSERVSPNTDLLTKVITTLRESVIASQIEEALEKPVVVTERWLKTKAGREDSLSKTAGETRKAQQPSSRTELTEREVAAEVKAETPPSVPVPQLSQSPLSVALQSGPLVQTDGQKERSVTTAQKTEPKVTVRRSSSPRGRKDVVARATPSLREVTPSRPRSSRPQGEKQVASPDSSATLPGTNVARARPRAAAEKPMPDKITVGELSAMLRTFIAGYEAGDLNRFMGLFAEEAHTNERKNRDQIRKDYEDLFLSTDMRRMVLQDLRWDLKGNRALGWGNFDLKVQNKGQQKARTYSGSLAFQIERQGQAVRITRLTHSQNRVKADE